MLADASREQRGALRIRPGGPSGCEVLLRIPLNPIAHSGVFDHPRSEAAERPTRGLVHPLMVTWVRITRVLATRVMATCKARQDRRDSPRRS